MEQALQFVGICIFALVLAYGALLVFSWAIRHVDWLAVGVDTVLARRRGYRLLRMVPTDVDDDDVREIVDDLLPPMTEQTDATELLPFEQTDRQTASESRLSAIEQAVERAKLDRSKEALIVLLVELGWGVGDIRAVVKGDNNALSALIAKAKAGQPEPSADEVNDDLGQIVAMIEDPDKPSRLVPVRSGPDGSRYTIDDMGQPRPLDRQTDE